MCRCERSQAAPFSDDQVPFQGPKSKEAPGLVRNPTSSSPSLRTRATDWLVRASVTTDGCLSAAPHSTPFGPLGQRTQTSFLLFMTPGNRQVVCLGRCSAGLVRRWLRRGRAPTLCEWWLPPMRRWHHVWTPSSSPSSFFPSARRSVTSVIRAGGRCDVRARRASGPGTTTARSRLSPCQTVAPSS